MKQRTFPIRDLRFARVYILQLLELGLPFEVIPYPAHGGNLTNRVDVILQEPVAPKSFPNPEWVCQ
jgi:hypothetical protein